MKAILKVHKNSAYANYNGLTFEVNSIVSNKLLNLQFDGFTADFSCKEVIIVDINTELQRSYDDANWNSNNYKTNNWLINYCAENNILATAPTYNCPA